MIARRAKRAPRRRAAKYGKRMGIRRRPIARAIVTNTAAVRENYTVSVPDGSVVFFSTSLAATTYNRAQGVASAFQEYRIKYIKLTMKPSADTFPLAAGNVIPQLYFQMNKYQSIPTNANLQTLLDMGCKPIRFDDKNIVRAWKPTVLLGTDQSPLALGLGAAKPLTTPYLSTNNNAQNPGAVWAPSNTEHLGCCFFVTKVNPATPTVNYNVDVEVVFQFRRPLSTVGSSIEQNTNVYINGDDVRPIVDPIPVSG